MEFIGKLLALPIDFLTFIITKFKTKAYNPEKRTCPCCGFKGDKNSGGIACTIRCRDVRENSGKSLIHTCLRCYAQFATPPLRDAATWALKEDKINDSLPKVSQTITIQPKVN